jgi:hypothetical protein
MGIFLKHDPVRRRRWLQYSLRSLLVCVLLASCVAAVYVRLQQRGERLEKYIYRELTAHRHCSTDGLSISVADVDGGKLVRPTIRSTWDGKTSTIVADAAWITGVANNGKSINFRCRDARFDLGEVEATAEIVVEFTLPTCRK